jgi:hypothetical protein
MAITVTYLITLESRRDPVEVLADQRDFAALEVADLPEGANYTRARYLAWRALRRTGYTTPWAEYNEVDCVRVEVADKEGEQGDPPHGPRVTFGTA